MAGSGINRPVHEPFSDELAEFHGSSRRLQESLGVSWPYGLTQLQQI